MKEEKTHTRNQRRMYRIHKLEEKVHKQDLLIGSLQSQLKAKEEVIKEIKKFIEEHLTDNGRFLMLNEWQVPYLLEILSKGENK